MKRAITLHLLQGEVENAPIVFTLTRPAGGGRAKISFAPPRRQADAPTQA